MGTRWTPDTCGCSIEYDVADDGVTVTHVASHLTCQKHAGKAGQDHLDTVLTHNRAKNLLIGHLMKNGLADGEVSVAYDPDATPNSDPLRIIGATPAIELKITAALAKLPAGSPKTVRGPKG